MINLLCIPSLFKIVLWVTMETVRFYTTIKGCCFFLDKTYRIELVPMNNLVSMKNCSGSGVQSRSN